MVTTLSFEPNQQSTEDILDYALKHRFGDIHCRVDPRTGMKAIIAIHSTKLGPALGGCRFIEYSDTNLAFLDVMRLARGMSYKSAIAGLPLGGGKAVVIKPSHPFDREAYFHAFGEFVDSLGGQYITALDSGAQLSDMDIIGQHTAYVASLSRDDGDPSIATAVGILRGIEAAVAFQKNRSDLEGMTVAIQGLGHVGCLLARSLHERGAKLIVTDCNEQLRQQAAAEFNAKTVAPEDIHKVPCDVYAPCALGAIINDRTINELQTSIIAGCANNQLAHPYHGQLLHDKGILYAPDYVINSGGVIFACAKYYRSSQSDVNRQLDKISQSLTEIFVRSKQQNKPTSQIADAMAEDLLME